MIKARIISTVVACLILISIKAFAAEAEVVAQSSEKSAQELLVLLEVEKSINAALDSTSYYYKNVPKESDSAMQKKVDALYQQAEKKYEQQRPELKAKALAGVKDLLKKRFSAAELQYLVVLSKYPVFKKLKAFLESDAYNEVLNNAAFLQKPVVMQLKKQVKDLKSASPGK